MFLQLLLLSTVASLKVQLRTPMIPRPVQPRLNGGISSLLKLTEKNVNNETRDGLLQIIKDAENDNSDALAAAAQTRATLDQEKIALANSIIANGEEKAGLEAALATNGRAQDENVVEKKSLDDSKKAFAELVVLMESNKDAYPAESYAQILKINADNNNANNAALAANYQVSVELGQEETEIKASLDKNAEELATIQTAVEANKDGFAANDILKQKLDKTTDSIAKIKEVIEANSEEKTKTGYLNYRFRVTSGQKNIGRTPYVFCIKEFWLKDNSGNNVDIVSASSSSMWSSKHDASNIVAHPPRDDFCTKNGSPTGWVMFGLASRVDVASYKIKVRGIARHDPQTWVVEGANSASGPWSILDEHTNVNLPWAPTTQDFDLV